MSLIVASLHSNAMDSGRDIAHLIYISYRANTTHTVPYILSNAKENMSILIQQYIVPAAVLLGVTILAGLACGMWVYRLWSKRGFYFKDFEKLSHGAKTLCSETAQVHRAVTQDDFLEASIRITCMEIVNAADKYDIGIRIALASWEDMMYPSRRDSAIEVEGKSTRRMRRKLGRYWGRDTDDMSLGL
jgi:hypothetical protein